MSSDWQRMVETSDEWLRSSIKMLYINDVDGAGLPVSVVQSSSYFTEWQPNCTAPYTRQTLRMSLKKRCDQQYM